MSEPARSPDSLLSPWRAALSRPRFRVRLALCALSVPLFSGIFSRFVAWVEQRPGVVYADPILEHLPAVDVTWVTFGLLYVTVVVAAVSLRREPERIVHAFQTWGLMLLYRMIAMWLLPLEPPRRIIPLADPFVQAIIGRTDLPPLRDLFFSGHTATMTVVLLAVRRPALKAVVVVAMAGVIVCLLIQHVHYSVDIFIAPFVVYAVHQALRRGEELASR